MLESFALGVGFPTRLRLFDASSWCQTASSPQPKGTTVQLVKIVELPIFVLLYFRLCHRHVELTVYISASLSVSKFYDHTADGQTACFVTQTLINSFCTHSIKLYHISIASSNMTAICQQEFFSPHLRSTSIFHWNFVLPKLTICLSKTESPPLARMARRPLLPSHSTASSVANGICQEMRQSTEELEVRFLVYPIMQISPWR